MRVVEKVREEYQTVQKEVTKTVMQTQHQTVMEWVQVPYTETVEVRLERPKEIPLEQTFEQMDVNHDGIIDQQELRAAQEAQSKTRAAPTFQPKYTPQRTSVSSHPALSKAGSVNSQTFEQMDVNHDGIIDQQEFRAAQETQQTFEQMDVNHDGILDQQELSVNSQTFEQMDVNHDGIIDQQEYIRAEQEFKPQYIAPYVVSETSRVVSERVLSVRESAADISADDPIQFSAYGAQIEQDVLPQYSYSRETPGRVISERVLSVRESAADISADDHFQFSAYGQYSSHGAPQNYYQPTTLHHSSQIFYQPSMYGTSPASYSQTYGQTYGTG